MMKDHDRSVAWVIAAAGASAALGWAAYAPMRAAFFRHDDFGWLAVAQRWQEAGRVWPALAMGHAGFTVLYNVIYYACYLIGGLDPRVYWDALLLAHALNCALVVAVGFSLTGDAVAAAGAGAVFAVLFSHHEAVGWLGGGLHVFALAFMLLAFWAWVGWRRRGRAWLLAAALVAGTCALLTKASAVPLALLVGLWEMWLAPRRNFRALVWWLLPYGVMVVLRLAYPPSHYVVPPGPGRYWPGLHALVNLAVCVPQMLVPDLRFSNYAAMVRAHLPPALASATIAGSLVVIAGLFAASMVLLVRGDRLTRFAVAWCYVAFLPFAPFRYDYALAPRYLYIPSVGLALLVGHWLGWVVRRLDRRAAAGAMAGFVFAVAAYNIPPLMVMEAHRLRDSAVRRRAIAEGLAAIEKLPRGARVAICGLPQPFADLARGLAVFSHGRARVRWSSSINKRRPGDYVLVFSADGRLRRALVPEPAKSKGRPGGG